MFMTNYELVYGKNKRSAKSIPPLKKTVTSVEANNSEYSKKSEKIISDKRNIPTGNESYIGSSKLSTANGSHSSERDVGNASFNSYNQISQGVNGTPHYSQTVHDYSRVPNYNYGKSKNKGKSSNNTGIIIFLIAFITVLIITVLFIIISLFIEYKNYNHSKPDPEIVSTFNQAIQEFAEDYFTKYPDALSVDYCFTDVNNDDMPEMIIQASYPVGMYTHIYLFDNGTFNATDIESDNISICTDKKLIRCEKYDGWKSYCFYRIENSNLAVFDEISIYEGQYFHLDKQITGKEYDALLSEYDSFDWSKPKFAVYKNPYSASPDRGDDVYSGNQHIDNSLSNDYNSESENNSNNSENYSSDNDMSENKDSFESYTIKVTNPSLNYYSGPGFDYSVNGQITDKGTYTIVEESDGWGKLKSGAGWVYLEDTDNGTSSNLSLSSTELGKIYNLYYFNQLCHWDCDGYLEDINGDGIEELISWGYTGGYVVDYYTNGTLADNILKFPGESNMKTPLLSGNELLNKCRDKATENGFGFNRNFVRDDFAMLGYVNTKGGTLNLRDEPSADSKVITEIPYGTFFNVYDQVDENGNKVVYYDGGWYYITVNVNNKAYSGWVSGDYAFVVDPSI